MLTGLAPERIDDIIAAIALYRPGPMDSIPRFVKCRHHPEEVTYETPLLEPILRSTYGCVVYQEQVMQIFRDVAGYSFGHADIVRRAMSKKKADVLLSEREAFVMGAKGHGVEQEVAEKLFSDMESFANYAFNKSHAAAYALISYRTAYLKQHYPSAYLSALMTSVLGNQTKIAEYMGECSARGIRTLPPDINESRIPFSTSGKDIRFGLLAIKNVGRQFLEQILSEREQNGKFSSFEDFISRMSAGDLNKRMVESLIKAGTFDRLGVYRSRLMAAHERLIQQASEKDKNNLAGQLDLFSMPNAAEQPSLFSYPNLPEFSVREKLMMEREAAGMFFSGEMMESFSKQLAVLHPTPISTLVGEDADLADRTRVSVAGMITSVTVKNTKKGERMAFFSLEDQFGEIECIAFPNLFAEYGRLIRSDNAVFATGTLSLREDEPPKLNLNRLEELIENDRYTEPDPTVSQVSPSEPKGNTRPAMPKRLYLRVPDRESEQYRKAVNLAEIFEGSFPIAYYDASVGQYDFSGRGIALSDYLVREFQALLGAENVILK